MAKKKIKRKRLPQPISKYIKQVYIIHQSGLLLLTRKYATDCIKSESTLIGSLITALLAFAGSDSEPGSCEGNPTGNHQLTEIATTCSRWIINPQKDFVVALLLPNKSRLLKKKGLIKNCSTQILEMYLLSRQFEVDIGEEFEISPTSDHEFILVIDNIIADLISEYLDIVVKISLEGEMEHYTVVL